MIRDINPLIRRALSMGRRVELVALRNRAVVTIATGRTLSEAARYAPEVMRSGAPWATGSAVIERGEDLARITALGDRALILTVDGDREIGRPVPGAEDAERVGILWAMAEARPSIAELHRCLMLSASLIYTCDPERAVTIWAAGDLDEVTRRMDLPAGEPTPERLYALAHCLEIPTDHPGVGGDALASLGRVVAPRWVLAQRLREAGRGDLAEMVMEAEM